LNLNISESILSLAIAALIYITVQRYRFAKSVQVEVIRENESELSRVGEVISCKIKVIIHYVSMIEIRFQKIKLLTLTKYHCVNKQFRKEEISEEHDSIIGLSSLDYEQIHSLIYFQAAVISNPENPIEVLQCRSKEKPHEIVIKFSARRAGICDLYIKLGLLNKHIGFNFQNSPIPLAILPGKICPENSHLELHNESVLTVLCGQWHEIPICPKDRYGNDCLLDEVDLSKFHVEFKSVRCFPLHCLFENREFSKN